MFRGKAADFAVSSAGVHRVSIRLDLETVFQFSHLVLKFKVRTEFRFCCCSDFSS